MRLPALLSVVLISACGVAPQAEPLTRATQIAGVQSLVVIGDSISIGYTDPLREALATEYDVRHADENCRNSYYTRQHLSTWTSSADSVVVWNNGVWDAVNPEWDRAHPPGLPAMDRGQTNEQYEANLIAIATQLRANGSRVLFMTTTDLQYYADGPFKQGRELELNTIAWRVLPPLGVEVYDLYAFAQSIPNAHAPGDVHFSATASQQLARYIAHAVRGES